MSMIKSEQRQSTDQLQRVAAIPPLLLSPFQPSMFQSSTKTTFQRSIDPHAMDISSIKGRFAWEKIPSGDTYVPVIFRGTTKYFCIKMLHQILPEYPEDVVRRSASFQYRKPIDLYVPTPHEVKLMNVINTHHSRLAYSRQQFTAADELVRVSDFLPFYEHLRSTQKTTRTPPNGPIRPTLPQAVQKMPEQKLDFVLQVPNKAHRPSDSPHTPPSVRRMSSSASELLRERASSLSRLTSSATPAPHSSQSPKRLAPSSQSSHDSSARMPTTIPAASLPSTVFSSEDTCRNGIPQVMHSDKHVPNGPSTSSASLKKSHVVPTPAIAPPPSMSTTPMSMTTPVCADPMNSSSMAACVRQQPAVSTETQSAITSTLSAQIPESLPPASKPSGLFCGWLQINKLYTPYVSSSSTNHHLYKIPVSLLTFYDLLRNPSSESSTHESREAPFPFEETVVTPQEIELINGLCLKQNIRPFSIDTKLIDLLTFYHYCSTTILFVKDLSLNEPKTSICKDWASVVQINGGICRLRNIATLHEQTVPFIGNSLLKTFALSSQCLGTATLTIPTSTETEFLQLILFLSNMPVNLRNTKLIDIESVQKEYNVDLILLFNDKFPLNVLNYQQQDNRSTVSQGQPAQSSSSTASITFTESTPPPSPPSPVPAPSAAGVFHHPPAHLPLTAASSSSSSSSASISASATNSRYQKTILFHGHPMTTYICSGLGSNAQRECISVRALCDMLYPHSSIVDKLEAKMLRLLRAKNINRFRPQNQQAMNFTRLVDIHDIEQHWEYLEQGMRSLIRDGDETVTLEGALTASSSDEHLKASTLDELEEKVEPVAEISLAAMNKSEKRAAKKQELEDNVNSPVQRLDKRARLSNDDELNEPESTIETAWKVAMGDTPDQKNAANEVKANKDTVDGKARPPSRPPIRIRMVRRLDDKSTRKHRMLRTSDSASGGTASSSTSAAKPLRKKIKLSRKRSTPRVRTVKESTAAWVQKYDIEECYVRLDLCDPAYKPRKH